MGKILVSIIIPVYQAETYLRKCVESILGQLFVDFQLILVDDGSVDNSGAICDEYASKDNRVMVVHQPNRGVSAARNAGVREAVGEWIYFVDADDWIEANLLSDFVLVLSECPEMDIYRFGYFLDKNAASIKVKDSVVHWVSDLYAMWLLNEKNKYFGFLWNMIVRKNLLSGLHFDEDLKWCEDHIFSYELFLRACKMYISDVCYYHHVQYARTTLSSAVHDPYKIFRVAEKERELKYKCMADHYDRDSAELIEMAYISKIDFAIKNLYLSNLSYEERLNFFKQIDRNFSRKTDLKWRLWYGFYFKIRAVYRSLYKMGILLD